MKAIVLAGGFAKRLWPLTKELAKPLVDVGGRPVIFYILSSLDKSKYISEILISTNAKFEGSFSKWLSTQKFSKPIKIISEPALDEGEKLGAIGGWNYVLSSQNIDEEILSISGDNIIGINIDAAIEEYRAKPAYRIGVYDIKELGPVKQLGEVQIDANKKIIRFREKPEIPETTLISTGFYIFPKGLREKIKEYLLSGGNKDAPGHFIKWLAENADVYAHVFDSYWFDIGDHQTLRQAREFAKMSAIK